MSPKIGRPIIGISIHALREEGDLLLREQAADRRPISIHALREEGDDTASNVITATPAFLSTPSARRATRQLPGHILPS